MSPSPPGAAPRWLFPLTIFLSAFLLFQVQPLISRHILPWFGGSAAVWSAAMLFFQAALLGGYAYADWMHARSRNKVHAALLVVSALVVVGGAAAWGVPLLPSASWKPSDASLPLLRILITLAASVGLPYLTLSTTSPLLQDWYARQQPGRSPYALYALSNAGSFLALITYPTVVEPLLGLRTQAALWAGGFILYLILVYWLMRGRRVFTSIKTESPHPGPPPWGEGSVSLISLGEEGRGSPITLGEEEKISPLPQGDETERKSGLKKLLWLVLPACSSMLLLAVTNQLTQEVAVIPFLWILPLSIYLLSYTLAFSGRAGYPRRVVLALLGAVLLLLVYAQYHASELGILAQILVYGTFLLLACLALHGELYRLRPPSSGLTGFYLLSSLGSVVGSLFVNLAAPLIFRGYWELPLSAALSAALVWGILLVEMVSPRLRRLGGVRHWLKTVPVALLLLAVLGVSSVYFYNRVKDVLYGALVSERNFYGVYRVRRISAGEPPSLAYGLAHGITWHGFQYTAIAKSRIPTSYYGVKSGIGLSIKYFEKVQDDNRGLNVGVIGLGTGTLAAYGREGDRYRFYEINPGIIALAQGEGDYFSYLGSSPADITVVEGDARVSLEQELAAGQVNQFDILAVDAFSSDSIPVHLLTSEAFELYLAHLQPQGVLAIHISNRYLDLQPLVGALAQAHGLQAVVVASPAESVGTYAAVWVLATRSQEFLDLPQIKTASKPVPTPSQPVRPWSDDYSNLVQFLRWEVVMKR